MLYDFVLSHKSWGKKVKCSELWHLPSQGNITHDKALLSQRWKEMDTCLPMGIVKEFLSLLCLHMELLFFLLHCLYTNPQIYPVLPFQFSATSHWEGSERLGRAELLAGANPQHTPGPARHSVGKLSVGCIS